MLRKIISTLVLGAMLLTGAGCTVLPQPTPKVYHNGYLGLAVTPPRGWQISDLNQRNITGTPEESAALEDLELYDYGDDTAYLELLSFQNKRDSFSNSYIYLDFSAEKVYQQYPILEQYVDHIIAYNTGQSNDDNDMDYNGTLIRNVDGLVLGGMAFTQLTIQVNSGDDEPPYMEEYYICQVGELYLTIYASYWSDNTAGEAAVQSVLSSCFTLSPSAQAREHENRVHAAETLYNNVLGLTVELPEGKYMRWIQGYNLTDTPGDTLTRSELYGEDYEDGGIYYELLRLTPLTGEDAQLELYGEWYEGADDLDTFVDSCIQAYVADTDNYVSQLLSRDTAVLDGTEFSHLILRLDSVDGESYRSEYYISKRGEGLYFFAHISYADYDPTKAAATEMLGIFSLGEISAGFLDGKIGELI